MLQRLPLDVSTFSVLRTGNYLYVDKTQYAYNLITGGRRFFISRPRRFGKSLFVSTLKEILLVNKALFDGLWIGSSDYSWKEHGVITLDLSSLGIDSAESAKDGLTYALIDIAKNYGFVFDKVALDFNPELILMELVRALYKRFGHVAILIDEYDNPILRSLKDPVRAQAITDVVRSFFTTIKALDEYVNF
jgi:hypothetical protein